MKCKYCKRELAENSIYCNWCGKKQFSSKGEINVPKARQLSSGKWFIQLRSGGRSVSITEDTEEACVLKAKATKAGLIEAQRNAPDIIVRQAVEKYISDRDGIISPSTKRGYLIIVRTRFKSLMNTNLKNINDSVLRQAVKEEARLCSPKTLKNAYALIAAAIFAETHQKYDVTLPPVMPAQKAYLTPEQIPIFLNAIRNTEIEIPCLLGLWSLRRSEIFGLSPEDINLSRKTITVHSSVVYDENGNLVKKNSTKNESSTRIIPLSGRLYDLLKAKVSAGESIITVNPHSLYDRIIRVCKLNNLPLIGVHGLRHSFASLCYYLNIPKKIVMQIGGWSDNGTMERLYTHISQSDVDRFIPDLSNILA